MPLDLSQSGSTPNIDAEVEAAEAGVVDLIEVDLGLGFKKFWSTTNIDIDWVVTEFGSKFEARLLSLGSRRWSLGLDDDNLNLTIGNADGAISRIAKEFGIDIFEGAQVSHHRLFTSVKEIYKDYWNGTGLPMQWSEGECSWDIAFGIASFKQKFGRKVEFTCPHVFAGGPSSDCPYQLAAAIGIPEPKVVKTATAGTTTSKVFVSGGGLNATSVGWAVFNRDENSYYLVSKVVDDTEIDVVLHALGDGGSNILNSGDKLLIGPPFTDCAKSPDECKERGMFGKHSGNPGGHGLKRRYFGGASAASFVKFSGRLPNPGERFGHGSADRFTRTSFGNDTLEGTVIPVIVGFYRISDIPSTYIAPAGAFQHGFFVICEGEIVNFNVLDVNGFRPDNNAPKELDTLNEQIQNDSFIKWGVWFKGTSTGIEDDRVGVSPDIAKRVRGAIGRRRSLGVMSGNKIIDTYGNGGVFGHPFLFNNGAGDGTSQHGLVAARIRIETQEDIQSTLTGNFDIHGLLVPLPDGMASNVGDLASYNFTGLTGPVSTLRYTGNPNPIQVAHELLRNRRWGAGIPSSKIDIAAVITESNFCEERVEGIESAGKIVTGTVCESSADSAGTPTNAWIFSDDIFSRSGSLVGGQITINKGTDKAFIAVIVRNRYWEEIFDEDTDEGSEFFITCSEKEGNDLFLDRPFVVGKEPVAGDAVEVTGGRLTVRFKANGVMADDVPIPDMLQSVLDNCNGTFRNTGNKIEFLIRKKLSATEIDTVISDGIFTDRGVKRNILRNNGVSTMKVWREDEKTLGNFFTVEFRDKDRNFQESRVAVFNDAAQQKASKLFGDEEGRLKIPDGIKLMLTTSKDQAARLLALRARELFIQNLFCEFETSLKRGMKAIVGDIIAVDSETIAGHFNVQLLTKDVAIGNSFLFRILEKNESSSYTIRFKCQVHVNPIYESYATDFTQFFTADEAQRERNALPAPVTPLAATERVVIGSDNSTRSVVTVKVTYPDLAV